jgi:hypothetical protein
MLVAARHRAKRAGVPFDLTVDDITIPARCPILGLRLSKSQTGRVQPTSPSLDRIVPERGYVRGNVVVVSSRANTLKRDATPAELRALAVYYTTNTKEDL